MDMSTPCKKNYFLYEERELAFWQGTLASGDGKSSIFVTPRVFPTGWIALWTGKGASISKSKTVY